MFSKIKQYMIWWALSVAIDIILLGLFFDLLHINILTSSLLAFVWSSLFGYLYHRNISFKGESKKSHWIQLGQFIVVNSTSQILYMIILYVWVDMMSIYYLTVAIIGKWAIFVFNYLLHKMFTFRNDKHNIKTWIALLLTCLIGGWFVRYTNLPKTTPTTPTSHAIRNSAITPTFEWITRYQIIPDRFDNGNPNNDFITTPLDWSHVNPSAIEAYTQYKQPRWSDRNATNTWERVVFQELVKNHNRWPRQAQAFINRFRWYGWDFAWIRRRMEYLKDLWVWGVFLNPVWTAHSAMRYDVVDYRHIDPRLSDNDQLTWFNDIFKKWWNWTQADIDFHSIVNEFHQHDMKVMIDLAFTYSAAKSVFFEDIARKWKQSDYYTWFELFYEWEKYYEEKACKLSEYWQWPEYQEAKKIRMNWRWWHCPKVYVNRWINGSVHPDLEAWYKAVIARWMAPQTINGVQYNWVDAIRLDAAFELPIQLRKNIYTYVKSIKPDAVVIWEERSNNFSFLWYKEFDWLTNYFTRTLAELFFIWKDVPALSWSAFDTLVNEEYWGKNRDNRKYTLNQIGSHDTDRIFSKLIYTNRKQNIQNNHKANLKLIKQMWHHLRDGAEVNKREFWSNYIPSQPWSSDMPLRKTIAMFQFMLPWAPNVYYGDEIGARWADDPDNRKPMRWSDYSYDPETICNKIPEGICADTPEISTISINYELLDLYKKLILLRKQSVALQLWSVYTEVGIDKKSDEWIYSIWREYGWEKVIFITNQSKKLAPVSITLNTKNQNRIRIDPITQKAHTGDKQWNITIELQPEDSIILLSQP
jgi:glycosidase/putative flippase GtrA